MMSSVLTLKEEMKEVSIEEKYRDLEDVQKATLNILSDLELEKDRLEQTQKAILNILDDFESERAKVERINEELHKKTEDLKRSNKELEEFAYVASHDLQEPLRTIASHLQLIERYTKGQQDPKVLQSMHFAIDGAVRMKRLIEDLLKYSRIGAENKPLEAISCKKVFENALNNLQTVIEERKASITSDPMPVIYGDEGQMTQLFQNLIGNSLKFCRDRVPQINISVDDEGPEWLFSFQDNGIGIKPEFYEKIFVIFKRLHTREEYSGTGIGLSICKKIVSFHGGKIWLKSEFGEGTTFYITIPKMPKGGQGHDNG